MKKVSIFFLGCALLAGCSKSYISVELLKTYKSTYASSFARSPDPRLLNPPKGEKLYVGWSLPIDFKPQLYRLKVDLIYKNLSTETLLYPIKRRAGSQVIEMLGKEFEDKKGFLAYKVEVVSIDGEVVSEYTHRMWTKLILPCGV